MCNKATKAKNTGNCIVYFKVAEGVNLKGPHHTCKKSVLCAVRDGNKTYSGHIYIDIHTHSASKTHSVLYVY